MIRLIPPKTKTSTTIVKGITFRDLFVTMGWMIVAVLMFASSFPAVLKYILGVAFIILMITSLFTVDNKKAYMFYLSMFQYFLRKKKVESVDFKEATSYTFNEDGALDGAYGSLKSMAVEIKGIDFSILTEQNQDRIINDIAQIFKMHKSGSIFKVEKPVNFSNYIAKNKAKIDYWNNQIESSSEDKKSRYRKRIDVLNNIDFTLTHLNDEKAIEAEAFYFVIYDTNEDSLKSSCKTISSILNDEGIESTIVDNENMKIFYEQFYKCKIENDTFALPSIKEKWNRIVIEGEEYRIATITHLPALCSNAWMWQLFSIDNTVVRLSFTQATNRNKVYNAINKSILELQGRLAEKNVTESRKIDINKDIESLQMLLQQLKMDNEQLHLVTYLILYPSYMAKKVDEIIKGSNIYVDHLLFHQQDAYMSMHPYKLVEPKFEKKYSINLQTSTLASTFPFVSHLFLDPDGDYLGDNRYPVFFDIFDSWKKHHRLRTNSNLVILGKSGGGKSFYTKKMLLQQACNGTKIFVLDPENEYQVLASNLEGNWIDMGGITDGRINPFHVFPSLDEDSEGTGELKSQRQFLQEFFTVVIPDLDREVRPFLNQAIQKVYDSKKINDGTIFKDLKAEDYPTFDDLYNVVVDWFDKEAIYEFDKSMLRKLMNALEDFKDGGLYSNLWNGPTTMKLENEFTVLNFQSLFASNNNIVANGQMLLAMRFLMQEVIKNKARNEALGLRNNIQIIVDEAHQFINPDFPVALTFMSQMTKRIRKYGGGMVVATQNIKDFIGQSESTKAKATAVLNGCQYSAIFGLLPDDVNSVIELYRSYNGGLTQSEIDSLTSARQGDALIMVDYKTRVTAHIELYMNEIQYLEK